MTSKNAEDPSWNIEIIPPNETGFAFYLSEYKPFRLTALREDPDAVRISDRRILAATTVFGPMPGAEIVSNPAAADDEEQRNATNDDNNDGDRPPLLYQFTGVYTRAEVRRQGLGRALSRAAAEYAYADGRRRGARCRLGLDVYTANTAAIAFYQSCGFVVGGARTVDADTDHARPEVVMYYRGRTGE
ncbi:hypothetical protein G7054_g7050 [Neopestalotiopsis clavispora]|nr:hypothetical protein G7054_g7050 [Neopestalotiopsis clavispora]